MEGNKHIDNDLQLLRDRFEMNPPDNAWNLLDADLERKQANMYKRSRNRFKLLSVCLALLLVPFIAFYCNYTSPTLSINKTNAITKAKTSGVNTDSAIKNTTLSIENNTVLGSENRKQSVHSKQKNSVTTNDLTTVNNSTSSTNSNKFQQRIAERKTVSKEITSHIKRNYLIAINNDNPLISNNTSSPNIRYKHRMVKEAAALENKNSNDKNIEKKTLTLQQEIATAINTHAAIEPKQNQIKLNEKAGFEKESISGLIDNSLQKAGSYAKQKELNAIKNDSIKNDTTTKGSNKGLLNQNKDIARITAAPGTKIDSAKVEQKKEATLAKTKNGRSPFSIGVYYTPNYFTGFRMERNTSVRSYGYNPNDYSQSEKTNYSFATGLKIRYAVNKHLGVSIGGTYSTLAYSMALSTIYVRYGSNRQLHFQYPTPYGNIEIPNTSNTTLHYGDSLKANTSCRQVIKLISVPLTVRYNFNDRKLKLYAEGGVSANFVLQERADLTIGNTQSTITNNISGLQSMNYGYQVSGGAEYAFYPHIKIFIEPSFRGSLTSLTQKTAYYCYPFTLNLNTGLSLHF